MELNEYVNHTDKILKGLESLNKLQEAQIPNFNVHGLLIYDDTRECFDIIGLRELTATFKREFKDATSYMEELE